MGLFFGGWEEKARDREPAADGVTLWQVLDVDERCIPPACRVAALKIPWWWAEHGRPAGRIALSVFLHGAINRCAQEGVRYPKVVLLRLKQMQRGEWKPVDYSRSAVTRRGGFQTVAEFLREGDGGYKPSPDELMD
jgi:hypothetical protein